LNNSGRKVEPMAMFPRMKPAHVMVAFGFGVLSTLIASWASLGLMLGNSLVMLPMSHDNEDIALILMAVMVAPFVEELAKPIGLYFLHAEDKPDLELKEWAFLGAMAGLGFAIMENFLYAISTLEYGADASFWLLGLRFLLPLHMIATAISGFGFGLWVKTGKAKYFASCMLVAMLLHAAFNLAAVWVG